MKEAKQPDLKAPRYRKTVDVIISREFFDRMRAGVPGAANMTDEELRTVIFTYNGNLYKSVISHRDGIELDEQLGHVFIGSCPKKTKTPTVDFKASAEQKKVIEHRNWESDQYIAKIFYTNCSLKYRFRNHELWAFKGTRAFTRNVASVYPKQWKQYIEIDHRTQVRQLFTKNNYRMYKQAETKIALEDYNEFDI